MATMDEAEAGTRPASNGTASEHPIDWLFRLWDEALTDEARKELADLPDDWLDQLNHYTYGTLKKPVLKYE